MTTTSPYAVTSIPTADGDTWRSREISGISPIGMDSTVTYMNVEKDSAMSAPIAFVMLPV
ncbi:hypothetical protein GCM10009539_58770 [Cryptosporangium japonicum]|uniref:Uncharacterized protein n=1 Tax=Cryptosporangium japonicum TaxID=80872 RepID=A0ABN0UXI8_9ACTN